MIFEYVTVAFLVILFCITVYIIRKISKIYDDALLEKKKESHCINQKLVDICKMLASLQNSLDKEMSNLNTVRSEMKTYYLDVVNKSNKNKEKINDCLKQIMSTQSFQTLIIDSLSSVNGTLELIQNKADDDYMPNLTSNLAKIGNDIEKYNLYYHTELKNYERVLKSVEDKLDYDSLKERLEIVASNSENYLSNIQEIKTLLKVVAVNNLINEMSVDNK